VFLVRLISKVRKELALLNFDCCGDLDVIKIKDDICLLRLENSEVSYIVCYCDNGGIDSFVHNWLNLVSFGLETGIVAHSSKVIVYKDYALSGFHRIATKEDCNSEMLARALARWYKKLHAVRTDNLEKYSDYFCLARINKMVGKFSLKSNPFIRYIISNFDNIKLKLDRLESCAVCGRFSLENVVVSKTNDDLFIVGSEFLCNGFSYIDIDYALSILDENLHDVFKEEYGGVNDDEIVVYDVVGCIVSLCFASECKSFPTWAKKYLNLVNSEKLLERARVLVEWY
jgi:hypothetical protein